MGVIPIAPAARTGGRRGCLSAPGDADAAVAPAACRSTSTSRGACASAPTATSTRTSRTAALPAIPEADYLRALRADLESALPLIWGRRIISVFIGGGTPSLLSGAAVETMLSDVRALLPLEADCEITLEANPGTVEAERFAAFRAAGVNRLSLGIQSFDDAKAAGARTHPRSGQALRAVEFARRHFDNFNLDLMYGLPQQTIDEAQNDLGRRPGARTAAPVALPVDARAEHGVRQVPAAELPDDDTVASMQEWIEAQHGRAGYRHYEVSAYARPGHECRHNLNYWGFGDYLGIGPGAHSKISFPHRIVRQVRFRQPSTYLRQAAGGEFVAESNEVAREELPFEFMLNAMRLTEGVPSQWFAERTGTAADGDRGPTAPQRRRVG